MSTMAQSQPLDPHQVIDRRMIEGLVDARPLQPTLHDQTGTLRRAFTNGQKRCELVT